MQEIRKIIQLLVVMILLSCLILTSCKQNNNLEVGATQSNEIANQGTEVIESTNKS